MQHAHPLLLPSVPSTLHFLTVAALVWTLPALLCVCMRVCVFCCWCLLQVTDIRLITDRHTKRSKGLAYVEFSKQEEVFAALTLTGQVRHAFFRVMIRGRTPRRQAAHKQHPKPHPQQPKLPGLQGQPSHRRGMPHSLLPGGAQRPDQTRMGVEPTHPLRVLAYRPCTRD